MKIGSAFKSIGAEFKAIGKELHRDANFVAKVAADLTLTSKIELSLGQLRKLDLPFGRLRMLSILDAIADKTEPTDSYPRQDHDVYIYDIGNLSISNGNTLGVQGQTDANQGTHLLGQTITIGDGDAVLLKVSDDDPNLGDGNMEPVQVNGDSQYLNNTVVIDGLTYRPTMALQAEYAVKVTDQFGNEYTAFAISIDSNPNNIQGLAFSSANGNMPPKGAVLSIAADPNTAQWTGRPTGTTSGVAFADVATPPSDTPTEALPDLTFGGQTYSATGTPFTDAELGKLDGVNWAEAFRTDQFFIPGSDDPLDSLGLFHWLSGDAALTNKVLDTQFSDGTTTFTLRDFLDGPGPTPLPDAATAGDFGKVAFTDYVDPPLIGDETVYTGSVTLPDGTTIEVQASALTSDDAVSAIVEDITPQLWAATGRPSSQRPSLTVIDNGDGTYDVTLNVRSGHPMDRGTTVTATISLEAATSTADDRRLQVLNGAIDGDTPEARAEDASLERVGETWAQVVDQFGAVPDWTEAEWFEVTLGFYSQNGGTDITRQDWTEFFELNVGEDGQLVTGPLAGKVVETFGSDNVRNAWADAPLLAFSAQAHRQNQATADPEDIVPTGSLIIPETADEISAARTSFATTAKEQLLLTGTTQFSLDDDNREFFLTGISPTEIENGALTQEGLANHALLGAIMWVGRDIIENAGSGDWWIGPTVAQLDSPDLVATDTAAAPNEFAVFEVVYTEAGEEKTVYATKDELAVLRADSGKTIASEDQVTDSGTARLFWAQEALQAYDVYGGQPPIEVLLGQAFHALYNHYAPAGEMQSYERDIPDGVTAGGDLTYERVTGQGTSKELFFDTSAIDTTPTRDDAYVMDFLAEKLGIAGDPHLSEITGSLGAVTTITDVATAWATGNEAHGEFGFAISRGPNLEHFADTFQTALGDRGRSGAFVHDQLDERATTLEKEEFWELTAITVGSILGLFGFGIGAEASEAVSVAGGPATKVVYQGTQYTVRESIAIEFYRLVETASPQKLTQLLADGAVAAPSTGALLASNVSLTGSAAANGFAIYQMGAGDSQPTLLRAGESATQTEQEDTTISGKERIDAINAALSITDSYRGAQADSRDPLIGALEILRDMSPGVYHATLEKLPADIKADLATWHAEEVATALSEAPFSLSSATAPDPVAAAGFLEGLFGSTGPNAADAGLIHSLLQEVASTYGTEAAASILAEMDPEIAALVVGYSQAESNAADAKSAVESVSIPFGGQLLVNLANNDPASSAPIMDALMASDPIVAAQVVFEAGVVNGEGDAAKLLIGTDPTKAGQVLALAEGVAAKAEAAGTVPSAEFVRYVVWQVLAQTDPANIEDAQLMVTSYLVHDDGLDAAGRESFVTGIFADDTDKTAILDFLADPEATFTASNSPELAAAVLLARGPEGLVASVAQLNDPRTLAKILDVVSEEDAARILGVVAQDRPEFAREAIDFAFNSTDIGTEGVASWFQNVNATTGGILLNQLVQGANEPNIASMFDAMGNAGQIARLLNTLPHDASEGIMALMENQGLVSEILFGGVYAPRMPQNQSADELPPAVLAKMDELATRVANGELTDLEARSELMDFMLNVPEYEAADGSVKVYSDDRSQSWSLDQLYDIYTQTKNEFLQLFTNPTEYLDSFVQQLDAFVQENFPALEGMRAELLKIGNVLFNGVGDMTPDDAQRRLAEIFEIPDEDVAAFIDDVRELMNTTNTTDVPSGQPSGQPSSQPSGQPSGGPTTSNPPSSSPTDEPYVAPERMFEAFASVGLNYQFRLKFSGPTTFNGYEKFSIQPIFLLGIGSAGTSGNGSVGQNANDGKLNYQVRLRFTLNGSTSDALAAFLPANIGANAIPSIDSEFAVDLRLKVTSEFGEGTRIDAVQVAAYNEPSVSSLIWPTAAAPGATPPPERPSVLNIALAQIRYMPLGRVNGFLRDSVTAYADFATWSGAYLDVFNTIGGTLIQGIADLGGAANEAVFEPFLNLIGSGLTSVMTAISNGASAASPQITAFFDTAIKWLGDSRQALLDQGVNFQDPRVKVFTDLIENIQTVATTAVQGGTNTELVLGQLKRAGHVAALGLLTVGFGIPAVAAYQLLRYVGIGSLWAGLSLAQGGLSLSGAGLKTLGQGIHALYSNTQGKWTFGIDWTAKLTWLNSQVVDKDDQGNDEPFEGNGFADIDAIPDILTFSAFGFGQAAANTAVPIPTFESIRNILNGGVEIGFDIAFTEDGRIKNADDRGITNEI